MLTLEDAHRITIAARRTAAENNWNVAIAVVDDGGHLISLERMDGTQKGSIRIAEQKARTADRGPPFTYFETPRPLVRPPSAFIF